MDRGAWWATVHGVAKSRTRLSDFTHRPARMTQICKQFQVFLRMWSNRRIDPFLLKVQFGTVTLGGKATLGIYLGDMETCLHEECLQYLYSNSPRLKTTQMSIKWMDKQVAVHWYDGIHFSNKKEETVDARCREPAWETPPMAKVMRKKARHYAKAGSSLRKLPVPEHLPPKPKSVLCSHLYFWLYGGLFPHHLSQRRS